MNDKHPIDAHEENEEPEVSTTARRLLLAIHELDGSPFENLLAVRAGLTATAVRVTMHELAEAELIAVEKSEFDGESFESLLAGL